MRWLLESVPNGMTLAQQGEICLGTIDSWLLWNLTHGKEFRCDISNASRTQLLNLNSGQWDSEMLDLFGIPQQALPEVCPSSHHFGVTKGLERIPDGIPILAMIGDSHAALFAHGLGMEGCVKATYGTGSSVMAPVFSAQSEVSALATTIAWHDADTWSTDWKVIFRIREMPSHGWPIAQVLANYRKSNCFMSSIRCPPRLTPHWASILFRPLPGWARLVG